MIVKAAAGASSTGPPTKPRDLNCGIDLVAEPSRARDQLLYLLRPADGAREASPLIKSRFSRLSRQNIEEETVQFGQTTVVK